MDSFDRLPQPVRRAAALVHIGLRDGHPHADALVDLACALADRGHDGPAVREILERLPADLTPGDLARLGRALLDGVAFGSGSWAALEHALDVVRRDLRAAGVDGPVRLTLPDWDPEADAPRVEFRGFYQGLPVEPGPRPLLPMADAVQEVVIEESHQVWPVCPRHGLGLHPADERAPVWRCHRGHDVAPIGGLPPRHTPPGPHPRAPGA
ncbi:hypothetical protein [Bailinhaonella thermotolerans]|uniref:Uncharacterized protein n=1 Tax=Bailinhaonella thermotolerans TaxID=1070861 RepID=A0A3A4BE75_9ACTN|nr:hypothetical protein [Bailinhaonella thermotolerans]RJL32590.1 hypothetical protein D5H75_13830 [Bailinhaonella thermotolerans]